MLIIIIIMFYMRFPGFINLIMENFYPVNNSFSSFPSLQFAPDPDDHWHSLWSYEPDFL